VSGNIANTFFESGPDDNLLTADVYEIKDNLPKNNLLTNLNTIAFNSIEEIRNDPEALNNIKSVLTSKASEKLTQEEVINTLIDSMGPLKSSLKDVSGPLLDVLTNNFNETPNALSGESDMLMLLSDGVKQYGGAGSKELQSLIGLVNTKIGGTDTIELLDLTLESVLTSSLLSNVLDLGLIGAARDILLAVKDPLIAILAIRRNLKNISNSGDIDALTIALDNLGGGRLRADMPDVIIRFLRNYRHPKDLKPSDYQEQVNKIVEVFNRIDSNWNIVKRDNEWVSDLTPFSTASEQAVELFSTDNIFLTPVVIAKTYRPIQQKQLVKKTYSKIGIQ
jgi:hypothetical protein